MRHPRRSYENWLLRTRVYLPGFRGYFRWTFVADAGSHVAANRRHTLKCRAEDVADGELFLRRERERAGLVELEASP